MIRFGSLELHGFKNTRYGKVQFPSFKEFLAGEPVGASVVGIYGQNGSGKTSVIEALGVLRDLMSGAPLSSKAADFIPCDRESFALNFEFALDNRVGVNCSPDPERHEACIEGKWLFQYEVTVARDAHRGPYISHESLQCKDLVHARARVRMLDIEVVRDGDGLSSLEIGPSTDWKAIFAGEPKGRSAFEVQAHIANETSRSVVFSPTVHACASAAYQRISESLDIRSKATRAAYWKTLAPYVSCIPSIGRNMSFNCAVLLTSDHTETVLDFLRIRTAGDLNGFTDLSGYAIDLLQPVTLPQGLLEHLEQALQAVNTVMGSLIPGLSLVVHGLGKESLPDGSVGERVEILSQRGERAIPLRCESEGIKKLVSITSLVVEAYNDPSALLAVDELDSGVFEYLLGQIVDQFGTYGKGQLVFTAHNLYPLEFMPVGSVVFTTANPDNRYVNMTGVGKTNNLRDVYLRTVDLGGQKERLYDGANRYELDDSFYRAGKILTGGEGMTDD